MRKFDRQEDSLWKAAFDGKAAKVEMLLRRFEPAKNRELFKDVLLCAVQNGHAPVVKVLLAAGADPEQADDSSTLLMNAAWGGHLDVVRTLIVGGARANRRFKGRTALEAALENNHRKVADYLRDRDTAFAMPTLMHACKQGDLTGVKKAIATGANIHRGFGPLKETALMHAAAGGRLPVVEYLLQQGADPNLRSKGKTALWDAAIGGSLGVIDALVKAGANVNDDNDGCTVLMAAAQFGSLPVVKRLVELGAEINATDRSGAATALDYARKWKNAAVILFLRTNGAISARDPARELARAVAREFGGRPAPVHDGFRVRSRSSGFHCQFRFGPSKGSVETSSLDLIDSDFRAVENAELIIGRKPERRRGRFQKVQGAEKILGVPVFRWVVCSGITAGSALRFCRRHGSAVKRLRLSAGEELNITACSIQFQWSESDERRLRERLRVFLNLVRRIARQGRPEVFESWDDD